MTRRVPVFLRAAGTAAALVFAALALAAIAVASAEDVKEEINYDEAKVGQYALPDPLLMGDGRPVKGKAMWQRERRPELLALFEAQVYGRRPAAPRTVRYTIDQSDWHGKATRKRVRVDFSGPPFSKHDGKYPGFWITMYVPRGAGRTSRPVPAFVGMHLFDTKQADPIPGKLLEEDVGVPLPGERTLQVILERGYAIATLDAADFCPDDKAKFREGVLAKFYPDQTGPPGAEQPGAIATWAWALSRALDYFRLDRQIDARRVAVIGHSRMGKTALWAGAEDPRFALVISNDSGCGGAALSKRLYGETVGRINRVFPHWFCGNFKTYSDHEDQLPLDQHELVALVAPRPVYVASAIDDRWADPRGEYLAAIGAAPVYRLFGYPGFKSDELPTLNQSVGWAIGYHIRAGKHALTDFDWLMYLDFADRHLKRSG